MCAFATWYDYGHRWAPVRIGKSSLCTPMNGNTCCVPHIDYSLLGAWQGAVIGNSVLSAHSIRKVAADGFSERRKVMSLHIIGPTPEELEGLKMRGITFSRCPAFVEQLLQSAHFLRTLEAFVERANGIHGSKCVFWVPLVQSHRCASQCLKFDQGPCH